jgi:hypothetical protein
MEQIIVEIEKGTVKIEAHGFHGPVCLDATRGLEEALGNVENRSLKPLLHGPCGSQTMIQTRCQRKDG